MAETNALDNAKQQSKPETQRARLLLVTGLSGAGKSTVLNALEDAGYETVDNLPFSLLPNFLGVPDDNPDRREQHGVAIGIDSRTRGFKPDRFIKRYQAVKHNSPVDFALLYCDCSNEVLRRRYSENRRRHPLTGDRPVLEGIEQERLLMAPISEIADEVIDSTESTLGDLRRRVMDSYGLSPGPEMAVTVMSFSYSRGLPADADLVFDVRFLANPHYLDSLRERIGWDPEVGEYIAADPAFHGFYTSLCNLILPLIVRYRDEGKAYLTIAIGCTGGRHRSVYVTERIASTLRTAGHRIRVVHREQNES